MAGTGKGTYKITNPGKYNESLVQRGLIAFWSSEEVTGRWAHTNGRPKVGHPFVYSDRSIFVPPSPPTSAAISSNDRRMVSSCRR